MTTMPETMFFPEAELERLDNSETSRQFIHKALDLALSLGDFQKQIHHRFTPLQIVTETADRISNLITFDASALYLVEEESSDLRLSLCTPDRARQMVEDELGFMIQNGFVGWAIRERRGITVSSKNGRRQIVLHVMSTYSRTRGMFVGIFPEKMRRLPDASLEILSIILRNAANSIESLQYNQMLQQQKRELEQSVELKSRRLVEYEKQLLQAQSMEAIAALAGGVAHQFNNTLTGLNGYLDLIATSLEPDSESSVYFERIRPLTERMAHLTSHLLAYAQGGKYTSQSISLQNLVTDLQPVLRRSIKPSVTLAIEIPDACIDIRLDILQMRMAILAILENANEAIEQEGTITLRGSVVDSTDLDDAVGAELKAGRYACLSITDNGRGMDADTLRRIFEPFFTTKFQGRGLSMAAVFGIVKNHGGWIQVDSRIDQGTTVNLYLPITGADARGTV